MSLIDKSTSPPTIITFSSQNRIGGTNSSFQSEPVDLGVNDYNSVCLIQASIPKSYYNMPNGYNTFTLRENGVDTLITVPIGNYTKINLATKLSSIMTSGSSQGWTYSITYPPYTEPDDFKFTFTVSGNGGLQPSIILTESSPFRQLGFDELSTNVFVANVLRSTNAINLSYVLRMFIHTDLIQNANDSTLDEIMNVGSFPPQGIVYYQQQDVELATKEYNPSGSNSWKFTLVDGFNQIVDLNGIPYSFTVCFYTRNNIHEIQKADIKFQNEQRLFQIEQAQQKLKDEIGIKDEEQPIPTVMTSGEILKGALPQFPVLSYPDAIVPDFLQGDEFIQP